MLNKKEISIILLVSIIVAATISIFDRWDIFSYTLLSVFLIIVINVIAKKVASFYLDAHTEIKLWEIERYGFRPHEHFRKPVPAGVIMPVIFSLLSFGYFTWMAVTTFEVKPRTYRAAKRFGLYSFSEMSEYHLGLIAAAGILANLVFAVIGYFLNVPQFSRLSVYYALFNMLPLSDLDGNKIFFGSIIMWAFLAALVAIGVFFTLFVI
jgi:hypothetical protein